MDGTLVLLLLTLFVGAFVSGLAGFAMGIIVLAVWLHFLPPITCAVMITGYGLITQGYGVWKLRHAFSWRRVLPFITGGLVGVPLGVLLLAHSNPTHLKVGVGVLVIAFSVYGLARPALRVTRGGTPADVAAGVANGLLAGLTGLIGIVITIWCQMRGWTKDVQRTVFQPVMLATSIFALVALVAAGAATPDAVKLFVLGVPFVFAGTWLGLWLYGRIGETGFRRIVLVALLASGVSLLFVR